MQVKMFFRKLGVIIYKNLLLRRSQWFKSTLEFLLPISFVALVCFLIPNMDCVDEGNGKIEHERFDKAQCKDFKLSYAPVNAKTREVIENLRASCSGLTIQERHNETILEKELKDADDNEVGIVFPDDFEALLRGKVENKVISYKIRMHANITKLPSTEKVLPTQKLGDKDFAQIGPNYYHGYNYSESNFIALQRGVDAKLIEMITGQTFNYKINLERFAYYLPPKYPEERDQKADNSPRDPLKDRFNRGSDFGLILVPVFISLSLLFMVPTITRNVVSEKQTGITELLKSAGVSGGIQWLGWMINCLLPLLISMSLCTVLLFSRIAAKWEKFDGKDDITCQPESSFVYSDWTLVWFILCLYSVSIIAFLFFICSIVKKPTIATAIALVICMVSSFVHMFIGNQVVLSVFPNCALAYAFSHMGTFENNVLDDSDFPYGAQWDWQCINYAFSKRYSELGQVYDVSLLQIIGMMIADIIVYSLLALYFENVLPSEHGVRRPWYLFNYSQMFKKRKMEPLQAENPVEMEVAEDKQEVGAGEGTSIKGELSSARTDVTGSGPEADKEQQSVANSSLQPEAQKNVGVEVQNMSKNFGRKMAVNGVSLKMYTGDIFALLGHNGAGKTTLISMITGFFSPTSGTAIVDGHDIRSDLDKAREHLGLCPQHNMLFDNITVLKQLVIFGMLRGLTWKEAKQEAEYLLFKMNLVEKEHSLAKKLSGGQKRKLSLAMALIGGTKVVILDEPTSGMDPQARREIWDLLLELRSDRTILLTTHFMEEADVLGDRIGIMAAGKLQCIGTTAFLKKYYGTGLNLKLTLRQEKSQEQDQNNATETQPEESSEASKKIPENPNIPKIVALVQKHISNASMKRDRRNVENSSEVFLTLPADKATTSALTSMFTDLKGNKENLGIQTIGLQQTTMDEVFLRVGELAAEEEQGPTQKYEWTEDDFGKAPKMAGSKRLVSQFVALLRKKWILFKRKWLTCLLEAVIPLLLILLAIILLQSLTTKSSSPDYKQTGGSSANNSSNETESDPQPPLLISLKKYSSPISYYYSKTNPMLEPHIKAILGSSANQYDGDSPDNFNNDLAEVGKSDMRKYKRRMIIAIKSISSLEITGMFNAYPYHSAPLALNTATNIALRAMNPSGNNQIQVINHPWVRHQPSQSARNYDYDQDDNLARNGRNNQYNRGCGSGLVSGPKADQTGLFALLIMLAFILFGSTFVVVPIEEKITNVKQLQLMTGLQPVTYWLAHFVWDYILHFLVVLLTLVLVAIVELSGNGFLSVNHGAGVLFLILMCYGFSFLALDYLLSLRSRTVAGGFSLVIIIHLFTGIILGFIVVQLNDGSATGVDYYIIVAAKVLGYFFPSMPALLALKTYMGIALKNIGCEESGNCCPYLLWSTENLRRSVPGVGQELFFVVLQGVVYVILLILIEYRVCRKICGRETPPPFPPNIYDDDVYQEADRVNSLVQSGQVGTECMVVQNLSKAYGGFAAVSQINFAVHYGECFGLLGVNGAGKTTVFKMITGEEFPSEGIVFGFGTTSLEKPRYFFSNIGYCPQFDAILVVFTGREMLELFGVLRGLSSREAKMEAIKWLQRFGLLESGDVQCGRYSGGMKRRLSTAMAMIGDPALLLLDEPTSGVDPVSRHQFWGILEKIRDSGKSIILTSHSMDECEALCSRLGIMVNGQFQCFGGVQHLKSKFAQGYSLIIKLKPDLAFGTPEIDDKLTKFQEKINETFHPCSLKDKHENLLQYHLENPSIAWDALFKMLEDVKKEFDYMIEDYSVNETSLEEVFLAFAKSQCGERRVEIATCAQVCTCSC